MGEIAKNKSTGGLQAENLSKSSLSKFLLSKNPLENV